MGIRRKQVVIAALIVASALGYLIVTGMRDTMMFYYTVSEVTAQLDTLSEVPLRVAGKVVAGTIQVSESNHLDRQFVIQEGGTEIPVTYHGITPDTLVDGADAVVEGELGADGVFHATFVMAKCPSKYAAETDLSKYREAGVAAREQTSP
jgi:cytochrome c-type biogenesis protein CcmE